MKSPALTRAACLRLGIATTSALLLGNACDTNEGESADPDPSAGGAASDEPDHVDGSGAAPAAGQASGGEQTAAAGGASEELPSSAGAGGMPGEPTSGGAGAGGDDESTAGGGGVPSGHEGGGGAAGAGAAGAPASGPACMTLVGLGGDFPHQHPLEVTWSDVEAGKARLYTLFGDHAHNLLVTAADFAKLQAGEPLELECSASQPGLHTHSVRIACA